MKHEFLVCINSIPGPRSAFNLSFFSNVESILSNVERIPLIYNFIWQCVFWDVRVLFKVSRVKSILENYRTSRSEQVMGLLNKTNLLSILCRFCLNFGFAIDSNRSSQSIKGHVYIISNEEYFQTGILQPCKFYQWVTWNIV